MIDHQVRSVTFSAVAVICFVIVKYTNITEPWKIGVGLLGAIFALMAASSYLVWAGDSYNSFLMRYQAAKLYTPFKDMLRDMMQMDEFSRGMLSLYIGTSGISYEGRPGNTGPSYELLLGDERIPRSFVRLMLKGGKDGHLYPVRRFGDGTKEREWAELLTGNLVTMGYAERGSGPRAANWKDEETEARALHAYLGE